MMDTRADLVSGRAKMSKSDLMMELIECDLRYTIKHNPNSKEQMIYSSIVLNYHSCSEESIKKMIEQVKAMT